MTKPAEPFRHRENGKHPAVLITGASSGIGKACALRLVRDGFAVFAAVRKDRDAQELERAGLTPVVLDVTKAATIAAAARTVAAAVGDAGLAGLVNNAGIAVPGPIELVPIDELRRQFEVNVFGQVAVTQAFLPLLRAARGRIVNLGSVGARFALPFAGALNASKGAFELISDALRMELRPWGIRVIVVSPGAIRTAAEGKLVADTEASIASASPEGKALYASSFRAFVAAFEKLEASGVGPEAVADAVAHALTARVPRRRYAVGPKSTILPLLFGALPAGLADEVRLRLFHVYRPFGAVAGDGSAGNAERMPEARR
jgi:NAD(P)-dependent dehydrogenase (short-subunit alcohol dehydrogenase family)